MSVLVGSIVGLYLALLLLASLPSVRAKMADGLAEMLSQKIGSRVEVGSVKVDLFNTITIDSMIVYDQQSEAMLSVGKAVGTVEILPLLFKNTAKISSFKVFGAQTVLYRATPDAHGNWQFALDSLMPKDNRQNGVELDLKAVVLRDIAVRYDVQSEPASGNVVDFNHIDVERLNASLVFGSMKADSVALRVRDASIVARNGVKVEKLRGNIEQDARGGYTAEVKMLAARLNDKLGGTISDSRVVISPKTSGNADLLDRIAALDLNSALNLGGEVFSLRVSESQSRKVDVDFRSNGNSSFAKVKLGGGNADGNVWYEPMLADIDFDARLLRADVARVLDAFDVNLPENELISALDFVETDGHASWREGGAQLLVDANAKSNLFDMDGLVDARGSNARYNINITRARIPLGSEGTGGVSVQDAVLVGDIALRGHTLADVAALGRDQVVSNLTGSMKAAVGSFAYDADGRQTTLNNVSLAANSTTAGNVSYTLGVEDPNMALEVKGLADNLGGNAHLTANADVKRLRLAALGVKGGAVPTLLAGNIEVDAHQDGSNFDNYTLNLRNLRKDGDRVGDILLSCRPNGDNRVYNLESDVANGKLSTNVGLAQLASVVESQLYAALPALRGHAEPQNSAASRSQLAYGNLSMKVFDLSLLSNLLGDEVSLGPPAEITGRISAEAGKTSFTLHVPELTVGESEYESIGAYFNSSGDSLSGSVMLTKFFGEVPVRIENHLSGRADQINLETLWKNQVATTTYGSLKTTTRLHRAANNHLSATTHVQPTSFYISDTPWQISPATVEYGNGALRISDLIVSRGEQYVNVNADFGGERKDLFVQLNDVEVSYLLGLTNFKPVEFGGKASGTIRNSALNPEKELEADFFVRDFLFNGAYLGALRAKGGFDLADSRLTVKAKAQSAYNDSTLIDGMVDLKDKTLDFHFKSEKTNLQFLNKYVGRFIADLEGTTTGDFHLFGTLKYVQMEADETINYLKFRPKILGVLYTMENQPMSIRPDTIDFTGFVIRDPYGNEAEVKGGVNHHYLFDFNYDIDFRLKDLLTINWREEPSRAFWGKVFADGQMNLRGTTSDVHLSGELSAVDGGGIDEGSALYYNSGTTGGDEEGRDYIHFVSAPNDEAGAPDAAVNTATALPDNSGTDVWMDVKVNATPEASLNIVTDPLTRDYMSLRGNGPLQISYYNKGRFALNGLYTVNSGNYKLTIKDIIHKNFDIQQGGFLRFHGAPEEADINLKGVHRVNSVSLSDLNVGASQTNSTVGVDCILNFTGKAADPKVSFDIDFPKANNDENLLLKKYILTEEDRNMQAVYLLSIGRFYTYNYNDFSSNTGAQNQSAVAMTSFLAGTLSGQINNILQDAFHITNWNFGTSIAAGRMGLNDMEVQGSLSGKMFNNRLLFNGNIGYRDQVTTYSNNFVGDFNLQWLLNKAGTISLKAYSETNDRYFTKSSLSTQGGGILFQRDFRRLRDFFNK